jgi:hypothetical protein
MKKYAGCTFIIPPGVEGGEIKEVYIPTEAERK